MQFWIYDDIFHKFEEKFCKIMIIYEIKGVRRHFIFILRSVVSEKWFPKLKKEN